MTTKLHELFQSLFLPWLQSGITPGVPIEGTVPEFFHVILDSIVVEPNQFTFDYFIESTPSLAFSWKAIEFDDIFDGQFFFYVPTHWLETQRTPTRSVFSNESIHQQSVTLVSKRAWYAQGTALLESNRMLAFAYYPLLLAQYHQWLFVAANDTDQINAYGVYSAGDWLIVVESQMPNDEESQEPSEIGPILVDQLTTLVNSNPWYGWIQAARAQKQDG